MFFTTHPLMENSSITNSMRTGMEVVSVSVLGNFAESNINAFPHAVSYCRRIILLQALETPKRSLIAEADWERQLEVLVGTDKFSRSLIKSHMARVDKDTLATYFSAAFEGMLWDNGAGLKDCGKSFVELGSDRKSVV